jgi:hypothetical protein
MKNAKTEKASPVRKSTKAKGMKMKDLEPSGSVKGGWAFVHGGSSSSAQPRPDATKGLGA